MKIEFKNVDLIYPNGYHALKNINLTINSGEFVALIGPSGAGKTSVLTIIPGMNRIYAGRINIGDKYYITSKPKKKWINKIRQFTGFIFQSKNLIETQTVFNEVATGVLARKKFFQRSIGFLTQKDKKFIIETLVKVDLVEYTWKRVSELSGGQKQRVALARTLVTNPKIILADEPVSALDIINSEKVLDYLLKICKKKNISVIINLHHVDLAIKYADRIVGLNMGKIVFNETPKKITEKIIKKIYGEDFKEIDNEFIKSSFEMRKIKRKLILKR